MFKNTVKGSKMNSNHQAIRLGVFCLETGGPRCSQAVQGEDGGKAKDSGCPVLRVDGEGPEKEELTLHLDPKSVKTVL